jgi:carbonic anhydrase/acetyltransferase-like protein (isoleucine patch superfamily)
MTRRFCNSFPSVDNPANYDSPVPRNAPAIHSTAFIADSAQVIGDIHVGDQASFWFGSVVRGDMFYIRIGDHTNVQDNCVLHTRYCVVVCASDNVSSISRAYFNATS